MGGYRSEEVFAKWFWKRVEKTDSCWNWTSSLTAHGYGHLKRNRHDVGAHRVSYEMAYGPIPDGMLVCHHCDNRRCVRPDHLFLGTVADNNADTRNKGRSRQGPPADARGENNNFHKLTWEQVREIRRLQGTKPTGEIAAMFGIGRCYVNQIARGYRWAE